MKKILVNIKWLFNYMASILMYSVIVILLLVGVAVGAYYIDSKNAAGNGNIPLYGAYVILTGSMEPIIKPSDAVIIRRANEDDISVGDVVTYFSQDPSNYGILITHRVVNIQEENGEKKYITKGDHNNTVDISPVNYSQIYGKVIMRIPKVGYIKYFLVSSYGWIMVVIVPSILIVSYDIFKIGKTVHSNMKRKKGEAL